jgi:hypothetical protein
MKYRIGNVAIAISFQGLAACQIYPYGGENIPGVSTSVEFLGCSIQANQPVGFYGQVTDYNRILTIPIDQTTSASTVSYTDSNGDSWYCWQKYEVIGSEFWSPASFGRQHALLATALSPSQSSNGTPTWYYVNDPSRCTAGAGSPQLTNASPCAIAPGSGLSWVSICAGPNCGL